MVSPEPPGFFVGVPGRGGRRVKRTGCAGLDLRFAGACFGLSSPDGQRHLGEAVLGSLTRKGGAVVLNVASEGSTDTISFNVRVEKSGGGETFPALSSLSNESPTTTARPSSTARIPSSAWRRIWTLGTVHSLGGRQGPPGKNSGGKFGEMQAAGFPRTACGRSRSFSADEF